ncbi:MAG: hypothetical protein KVP17_004555 [Porospora cf. gigantea B]|uniref:uncharacterized protein n=1 Tax=Porospora cf. gigantea B TaxID=2853592 RepID=UPI003571FBC5|nr:MAG: hypothetical protein KVP17_004555 [Porospora cf. gigantea B]
MRWKVATARKAAVRTLTKGQLSAQFTCWFIRYRERGLLYRDGVLRRRFHQWNQALTKAKQKRARAACVMNHLREHPAAIVPVLELASPSLRCQLVQTLIDVWRNIRQESGYCLKVDSLFENLLGDYANEAPPLENRTKSFLHEFLMEMVLDELLPRKPGHKTRLFRLVMTLAPPARLEVSVRWGDFLPHLQSYVHHKGKELLITYFSTWKAAKANSIVVLSRSNLRLAFATWLKLSRLKDAFAWYQDMAQADSVRAALLAWKYLTQYRCRCHLHEAEVRTRQKSRLRAQSFSRWTRLLRSTRGLTLLGRALSPVVIRWHQTLTLAAFSCLTKRAGAGRLQAVLAKTVSLMQLRRACSQWLSAVARRRNVDFGARRVARLLYRRQCEAFRALKSVPRHPQLPAAYDSLLPAAYDSQLPAAYGSQIPAAYGSQIPAAYGSQIPAAYGSQLPAAYDSQLPAAYDSQIPAAYGSQIPAAYDSQIPAAHDSQIPAAYDSHADSCSRRVARSLLKRCFEAWLVGAIRLRRLVRQTRQVWLRSKWRIWRRCCRLLSRAARMEQERRPKAFLRTVDVGGPSQRALLLRLFVAWRRSALLHAGSRRQTETARAHFRRRRLRRCFSTWRVFTQRLRLHGLLAEVIRRQCRQSLRCGAFLMWRALTARLTHLKAQYEVIVLRRSRTKFLWWRLVLYRRLKQHTAEQCLTNRWQLRSMRYMWRQWVWSWRARVECACPLGSSWSLSTVFSTWRRLALSRVRRKASVAPGVYLLSLSMARRFFVAFRQRQAVHKQLAEVAAVNVKRILGSAFAHWKKLWALLYAERHANLIMDRMGVFKALVVMTKWACARAREDSVETAVRERSYLQLQLKAFHLWYMVTVDMKSTLFRDTNAFGALVDYDIARAVAFVGRVLAIDSGNVAPMVVASHGTFTTRLLQAIHARFRKCDALELISILFEIHGTLKYVWKKMTYAVQQRQARARVCWTELKVRSGTRGLGSCFVIWLDAFRARQAMTTLSKDRYLHFLQRGAFNCWRRLSAASQIARTLRRPALRQGWQALVARQQQWPDAVAVVDSRISQAMIRESWVQWRIRPLVSDVRPIFLHWKRRSFVFRQWVRKLHAECLKRRGLILWRRAFMASITLKAVCKPKLRALFCAWLALARFHQKYRTLYAKAREVRQRSRVRTATKAFRVWIRHLRRKDMVVVQCRAYVMLYSLRERFTLWWKRARQPGAARTIHRILSAAVRSHVMETMRMAMGVRVMMRIRSTLRNVETRLAFTTLKARAVALSAVSGRTQDLIRCSVTSLLLQIQTSRIDLLSCMRRWALAKVAGQRVDVRAVFNDWAGELAERRMFYRREEVLRQLSLALTAFTCWRGQTRHMPKLLIQQRKWASGYTHTGTTIDGRPLCTKRSWLSSPGMSTADVEV